MTIVEDIYSLPQSQLRTYAINLVHEGKSLQARIQELLEANNAELERRRAVERDLSMAKVDSAAWRELYHAMREDYLRAERRLCALEGQLPMPFDEAD